MDKRTYFKEVGILRKQLSQEMRETMQASSIEDGKMHCKNVESLAHKISELKKKYKEKNQND